MQLRLALFAVRYCSCRGMGSGRGVREDEEEDEGDKECDMIIWYRTVQCFTGSGEARRAGQISVLLYWTVY